MRRIKRFVRDMESMHHTEHSWGPQAYVLGRKEPDVS